MPHKYLIKEFQEFVKSVEDATELMQHISERIHMHIPRYNWVGFYLVDPANHNALVLGPHTGSFTPTPTIPRNQGLCGAAFSSRQVVVADNVAEDRRYVSVSDLVKSHISVPLLGIGETMGVFSIESYFVATFKPAVEREFVQACAKIVASCAEHSGNLQISGSMMRTAPIPEFTNRRTPTRISFL
jgi:L-methionine (R)-S-oxide reductase